MLGLIALLATLQYRWLGQISAAERERMKATLAARTDAFANEFDQELTRAYLTFQLEPMENADGLASRIAGRYAQWQGTSKYPRLVKDVLIVTKEQPGTALLQRFNPSTGFVEPASWTPALQSIREHVEKTEVGTPASGAIMVRTIPSLWEAVPAIVIPSPVLYVSEGPARLPGASGMRFTTALRLTVLALDREYVVSDMLPALSRHHFTGTVADEANYEMAVVSKDDRATVFSTTSSLSAGDVETADARAEFFQVRIQDFGRLAADVRRFTTFSAQLRRSPEETQTRSGQSASGERERRTVRQRVIPKEGAGTFTITEAPQVSILLSHAGPEATAEQRKAVESGIAAAVGRPTPNPARWQLLVKHPAGSLETAVAKARRRNLAVSSGILAILGISIGVLVVSTRRAHELARQQMEFVAAVSHELRTPLAVIRSAADNLAEGIVHEEAQVRQYGALVRGEGRRLSEMVEQILELAGIQSGQRGFALGPVPLLPVVQDVLRSSQPLLDAAGVQVEMDVPEALPPVLGDEAALRRVVQNLVGNAIKYGKSGGWIGIRARSTARDVQLTVSDRGIGIDPAEQPRIFEPFYRAPGVIEAQIQGAGLGLSLVQRIVDAHGGRIVVQSTPGSGSEFTVHLPSAFFDSRERALAQDRSSESGDSALADVQGRASA